MKTAAIAATAILALLVVGVATTIYAQSQSTSVSSTASATRADNDKNQSQAAEHGNRGKGENNRLNLTLGQTMTLTGLTGNYASATNSSIKGKASANMTLTVSQVFKESFVLTITSGTLSVAGVNYGLSGGTLVIGPQGQAASGTGTTTSGGQFVIRLGIHGTSTTNSNAQVVLDFKVGGSEYQMSLGAPHLEGSDSEDS